MTNIEAAEIMKAIIFILKNDDYSDEVEEAIHMAINSLQAQEKAQEVSNNSPELDKENVELISNKRTGKRTETHGVCLDTISRQAAISVIAKWMLEYGGEGEERERNALKQAAEQIKELPSAQPETAKRIVGKSRGGMTLWYLCDMCNEPVDVQDNFCRGCGRRLTDE